MDHRSLHARLPWLTCALGAVTLAIWLVPGTVETLALDRESIAAGESWRLLTGHLAHWTTDHLRWDLLAFLGLGAVVEGHSRRAFTLTVVVSALAISGVVWFAAPHLASYRGLSGIDTALFAAAVTATAGETVRRRAWLAAIVPAAALLGFLAKSIVEWSSHDTVFVAASDAFVPVPIAHWTGAFVGAGVVLALAWSRRTAPRYSGSRNNAAAVQSTGA